MTEIIRSMRCAVYTRKSTSEGLEQDFNSLDAQREACLAYIASQRGEGWIPSDTHYDDGGFTGANIDRPALKQLISDIKHKKINCVVVYKVDRLSRSLLDFSQLLEFFDKNEVSFVSVTQNFNTKNSMGRLTLNILLSFAQFEREIISERTRDKMAASRMKGKFLGGYIPFGYTLAADKHVLIPHPEEAEQVRFIFDTLLKEQNAAEVLRILAERGVMKKGRTCKNGVVIPDRPVSRAGLHYLVHNPLYIGKVLYKGKIYEGEHEGLVSEDTFNAVQALSRDVWRTQVKKHRPIEGLLRNILYCGKCGSRMVPTYGKKGSRKHFYYVCQKCRDKGYKSCPTRTVRQVTFNEAVLNELSRRGVLNTEMLRDLDTETQNNELKKIIEKIIYRYKTQTIEILLRKGKKLSFQADVKPKLGRVAKTEILPPLAPNEPKIDKDTCHRVLALQIREYMKTNALSQKQCADALGMTQGRISQILKIL